MIVFLNVMAPLIGIVILVAAMLIMLAYPKYRNAFNICLTTVITFAYLGVFTTSMFLIPMIVFLVLLPACDEKRQIIKININKLIGPMIILEIVFGSTQAMCVLHGS